MYKSAKFVTRVPLRYTYIATMPKPRSKSKSSNGDDTIDSSTTSMTYFIEEVISNVLTNDEFLNLLQRQIERSLTKLTNQVDINQSDIFDLNKRLDDSNTTLESIQHQMEDLTELKQVTKNKLNDLEQYTRRNSVRVFGIEESSREETNDLIIELAAKKLDIKLTNEDLDRSHRVGKKNGDNPRAIIVKFARHDTKSTILRARRKLKGSRTVIKEDLTVTNLHLLKSVKDNTNISNAWSWDGRIFATKNGSNTVISIKDTTEVAKL